MENKTEIALHRELVEARIKIKLLEEELTECHLIYSTSGLCRSAARYKDLFEKMRKDYTRLLEKVHKQEREKYRDEYKFAVAPIVRSIDAVRRSLGIASQLAVRRSREQI